ncbi:Gfo/Idh/MocA family oxidoreductase [Paenibacillus nasutitermitis]|uniref:Gfo/Idh/MocA-like oxidoreductase N-terminal domain-containing protein n=1 Tax=Paenibacillus nasutitermitis TaxID=1652958 RepID=A0A916Z4P9_9BACL|nr:Gfo/Idh/MocA family oxidoreductase [Paenibacillus nasutitermitis]GGD75660.1 hypothetical protein GCM10010911_37050 [Paenibacillus nasutitermitis]
MKKIGFIDYYLDEWHANQYPGWIKEEAARSGRDYTVAYAWAEKDLETGLDTESWCHKHQVERSASIEELVDKSDCIIVLSPDHPEHHERLSRIALESGKPVYIDKTFSPDLQSGIRMFHLAEEHHTPLFSSSALRFSEELTPYSGGRMERSLEYLAVTGPGHYENYAVHQFEMIVSLMGIGANKIKSLSTNNGRLMVVDYADGRRASMHQLQDAPFQASMQWANGDGIFISPCTNFFPGFIHALLEFFETGIPPVPKEETLEIMSMIEAGHRAMANDDIWIAISRK